MAIGTLYISHPNFDFSKLSSKWLSSKNLDKIINSPDIKDYHTSIEDCGLGQLMNLRNLLNQCQFIEVIGLDSIDSYSRLNFAYVNLIYLLRDEFSKKSKGWQEHLSDATTYISEYTSTHIVPCRNYRPSNHPCVWIAGCSWSSAYGVNAEQRWGKLVADKMGIEEVNLANPGASIWDSSDQILRSDIQEDDIVIWGLTNCGRVEVMIDNKLRSVTILEYLKHKINYYSMDYFTSELIHIQAGRQLHQVINYCNKVGAKLYLINFLDDVLPLFINRTENFLDLRLEQIETSSGLTCKMIDYGTDDLHPGPLQHQEYAKKISNFIQGQ